MTPAKNVYSRLGVKTLLKAEEVVRRLWDGDPRIAILAEGETGLRIMVWTLRDDEHLVVAKAIRQIFQEAGGE